MAINVPYCQKKRGKLSAGGRRTVDSGEGLLLVDDGARSCTPVVRQPGHRRLVERHLAQRGPLDSFRVHRPEQGFVVVFCSFSTFSFLLTQQQLCRWRPSCRWTSSSSCTFSNRSVTTRRPIRSLWTIRWNSCQPSITSLTDSHTPKVHASLFRNIVCLQHSRSSTLHSIELKRIGAVENVTQCHRRGRFSAWIASIFQAIVMLLFGDI